MVQVLQPYHRTFVLLAKPRLPLVTFVDRYPKPVMDMKLCNSSNNNMICNSTAGTPLASRLMLPFRYRINYHSNPVDPLLVAVVLAKSNQWRRIAFTCTIASVIGGAGGWILGAYLGLHIHTLIDSLPVALAAPSAFTAVEAGFAKFGLVLVFLGAFSPLPYKVIAVSAGIGGFGLLPFLVISFIGRGLRFGVCRNCTPSWRRKN